MGNKGISSYGAWTFIKECFSVCPIFEYVINLCLISPHNGSVGSVI